MPVELSNPAGLAEVGLYHHVAVSTGSRTVHVAGQLATDASGALVGAGDLVEQTHRAYLNVGAALASVGAGFDDVVRLRAYLVDWAPERMADLAAGIDRALADLGTSARPPFTGIVVVALADPAALIEVEATAVLP